MTHKPAAAPHTPHTPPPPSQTVKRDPPERDTLTDTPELRFLRDEIEALLGSPTVRRAMRAPGVSYADQAEEDADSFDERDTEPSIDVRLLREAARAAGK